MGSSKDDARREFVSEIYTSDISTFSTKELVDELRKREGVDAYDVSVDGDSRILVWGEKETDTGQEKGAAIILRITD